MKWRDNSDRGTSERDGGTEKPTRRRGKGQASKERPNKQKTECSDLTQRKITKVKGHV